MNKKITVHTTTEGAELVSDAFFSLGADGVTVIDPEDFKEALLDKSGFGNIGDPPTDRCVKVSSYFPEEEAEQKLAELKEMLSLYFGEAVAGLKIEVEDDTSGDWLSEWKKYYKPITAGRFVVLPAWESGSYGDNLVVKIDPSTAFGTGEHETTRLMLEYMSETDLRGKRVADVGTGSGILGIAAAKVGAESVFMCDIDNLALKSALSNAALNEVQDLVRVEHSDLLGALSNKIDTVLANLTADILIRLSSELSSVMKAGGELICSGIINKRAAEVEKAFTKAGFLLTSQKTLGEWTAQAYNYSNESGSI